MGLVIPGVVPRRSAFKGTFEGTQTAAERRGHRFGTPGHPISITGLHRALTTNKVTSRMRTVQNAASTKKRMIRMLQPYDRTVSPSTLEMRLHQASVRLHKSGRE
jgi:hypothetical protein